MTDAEYIVLLEELCDERKKHINKLLELHKLDMSIIDSMEDRIEVLNETIELLEEK